MRYCHVTQVGKIEEVWDEFGKHCEQVRKLDRPCVNFDFVSAGHRTANRTAAAVQAKPLKFTFRSDGNQQLRCFYDSGHHQREVDDEGRQDYKNTYGFVIYWYNGPISWASKRHDHVGLSAPEDEYMALGHA